MKSTSWAAIATTVLIAACGSSEQPAPAPETSAEPAAARPAGLVLDNREVDGATTVYAEGALSPAFDPDCLIDEDGIAGIEMPETLGGFVGAFPDATALTFNPAFIVDFGALCARANGKDAVCAIFESYEVHGYDPAILVIALAAYAPQCRTAEGVGPGTSLVDAGRAYGQPHLSFNFSNEGREYVRFDNAPEAFSFRAEAPGGDEPGGDATVPNGRYAGTYADESDDYGTFDTDEARPDAKIWEVWLATVR